MGMYTEIYVNVDFYENTPDEVINTVKAMCDQDYESEFLKDKPGRWGFLFSNGSYYTPLTSCRKITYDEIGGHYSLIGKGDIKNYEQEIQQFFDYIKPHVENDFMGYYRYEESREPIMVYSRSADE